ncbi:MAG: alpha/beta hydrolase [Alphaproteobacteria bacterium]|nr:alpha/beta hydrolase [Alphaproteobacteria bacterium]
MTPVRPSLAAVAAAVLAACAPPADPGPEVGTPVVVGPGVPDPDAAYRDPWHAVLADAQIVDKEVTVGDVTLRYAEGPDHGPPLVLLHAQHLDHFSYSRVLPALSQAFHVFAVTYHGHGETRSPVERLAAEPIGVDLSAFLEHVVGEPVFLTGNSSGALLSVWLAANRPDLVRAVLLEDPPLFTSELSRSRSTVAYHTFTTCHDFLADAEAVASEDFLVYWLTANRDFVVQQAGEVGFSLALASIAQFRADHPGERVELTYLPDTMRMLVRGLDVYDPHFGDAFYDGRWSAGFDQAEALTRVQAPTLLLHARFEILEDGTLNGALDDTDAARALSLLPDGTYQSIDAEHVVHLDQPDAFVDVLTGFFDGDLP